MYNGKKILGVITARGGSKGVPRKNIKVLAGKPLIAYTIEAALGSKFLTRCIVSTDDVEIAEISKKYGGDVPFMRPAEFAQDTSTSMQVVQHALSWLENHGETYDYLMILQPTSPLRISEDIDESIKKIAETGADSAMSMMRLVGFSVEKLKKIENGMILPHTEEELKESRRRQDLVPLYKRNGAIYITKTELIKKGDLFGEKSAAYLMPEERSVDVNTPLDYMVIETIIKNGYLEKHCGNSAIKENRTELIWEKFQKGVFVIAEAGKNFIQSEDEKSVAEYLKNTMQLVDEAVKAGADAIKFQTHNVSDEQLNINVISPHFKGSDRFAWVSRNTLATPVNEFWKPLKKYCDEKGIIFFSTAMSRGAARILDEVGVDFWKIGSGDILDFPMLDYMRQSGKPVIISTGMSTMDEIEKAIKFLRAKNNKVAILHCVSKYPCPPEELQLNTIKFLKEKYDLPVGFSDHSVGIDSSLAAVTLGATILEKHFSMSRELWGSDHKVSLTPVEFLSLTNGVREVQVNVFKKNAVLQSEMVQKGMGDAKKVLQDGEAVFRPLFRKSLMAGCDIPAGTSITAEMLYAMRPQQYAGGLPSEEYENILGKTAVKGFKKYEPITFGTVI